MPANTKARRDQHYECWVLDYPDRFLVEAKTPDEDYPVVFYPFRDEDPYCPYLVDLSEYQSGCCGCKDFQLNVLPYLGTSDQRREVCKHIQAARRYLASLTTKPKPIPDEIKL